jgi:hypothetical protein
MWWFTTITPGSYGSWYESSPGHYLAGPGVTVGDNGVYRTFGLASAIAVPTREYLIATGNPGSGGNVLDNFVAGWGVADPTNPYIVAPSVLTAMPGDSHVALTWTAATPAAADARAQLVYTVDRRIPPGNFGTISGTLTALSYDSTGLVNGTTYEFRVTADVRIIGSANGLAVGLISNVVSAKPVSLREFWGAIAA